MRQSVWMGSLWLCAATLVSGQGSRLDYEENAANLRVDSSLLDGLQYRSVGFSRGGRSTAVAGVPGQPLVYYFGGTGGGLWKTTDAGNNWENVERRLFRRWKYRRDSPSRRPTRMSSTSAPARRALGATSRWVTVSTNRPMRGKTWEHIGLRNAGQIGKIRVHPHDADLVYVAALGHLFGSNPERGVFRSTDGGTTWKNVHFISERTGVVGSRDGLHEPAHPDGGGLARGAQALGHDLR